MSNIRLSKLAEKVIYLTIKESGIPKDKGLRITEIEGALTLVTDKPSKDDYVIKKNKDIVLIIKKELQKKIGSAVIDIRDIRNEPKLIINKRKAGNKFQLDSV